MPPAGQLGNNRRFNQTNSRPTYLPSQRACNAIVKYEAFEDQLPSDGLNIVLSPESALQWELSLGGL